MATKMRATLHTVVQVVVGLAAGMPILLNTSGIGGTWAGSGTVLAVAGVITRIMDSERLSPYLSRLGLSTVPSGTAAE